MKSNTKTQVLASDIHQKQDVCLFVFLTIFIKFSNYRNIKPNRYTKILDKKYRINGNEALDEPFLVLTAFAAFGILFIALMPELIYLQRNSMIMEQDGLFS